MSDNLTTRTLSSCQEDGRLCDKHQSPLQFLCTDALCRKNALLCSECLDPHRHHSWQTIASMNKQLDGLRKAKFGEKDKAEKTERHIKAQMSKFKRKIDRMTIQLQAKIIQRVQHISHSLQALLQCKQIDQHNVGKILGAIQNIQQQSEGSIQALEKFVSESIRAAQTKIVSILSDMQLSIDRDWLRTTTSERRASLNCLKDRIDQPIQVISNKESPSAAPLYVRFDQAFKHLGITLSEDGKQACYSSNEAKGPIVILNTKIAHTPSITFQVVKLDHTAFFFPDTTIMLGVCNPAAAKTAGLRRINQLGKGGYLIGSTGWAYHHQLPQFDRKNVVGWRFTQGDKITVEVNIEEASIRFVKQGFFFDSEFRMPLGLTSNEAASLQPCVSFDADVGAVVKVISPPLQ